MNPAVRAASPSDAPTIAAIYNQGIAGRGATFETTPRTTADIEGWFQNADRYPTLVIEQGGAASLALCRRCGFREVGVYEKHGRLDGQWLDVVIVERLIRENLETPQRQE